ncbi:hypothetical protein HWV62_19167 [Athelia sp. TMB]|nr:hypothetical protein HWV62_19167 [Athelia sp. TMB]
MNKPKKCCYAGVKQIDNPRRSDRATSHSRRFINVLVFKQPKKPIYPDYWNKLLAPDVLWSQMIYVKHTYLRVLGGAPIAVKKAVQNFAPICVNCPEEMLHPVTRFTATELTEAVGKATQILTELAKRLTSNPLADKWTPTEMKVVYFSHLTMQAGSFKQSWSLGIPIVVKDVQMETTGPEYFLKHFLEMRVDLEDCETGPKGYIAQGTKHDNQHSGFTVIHMDLTSAVNIMVWSGENAPEKPGYALWHIFPASVSDILRQFLNSEVGYTGAGDPIHSQTMCMTPSLLEQLYRLRSPGKTNLAESGMLDKYQPQALVSEFRRHCLATGSGDDILELYNTLWHTWCSLDEKSVKVFS